MTVVDATLAPVERISAQVREVRVGLVLLGLVAAVLMWVGRIPAFVVTALVWATVAVREGYREVRPPVTSRRPGEPARR